MRLAPQRRFPAFFKGTIEKLPEPRSEYFDHEHCLPVRDGEACARAVEANGACENLWVSMLLSFFYFFGRHLEGRGKEFLGVTRAKGLTSIFASPARRAMANGSTAVVSWAL